MKKKIKARDLREAKKLAKSESYAAKAVAVPEEKPTEEEHSAVISPVSDGTKPHRKSANKAAGLKSTLVCDDKLYMTSFGKGNSAVVEQSVDISHHSASDMTAEPSLKVTEVRNTDLSFSSKRPFVKNDKLSAVNPLHSGEDKPEKAVGQDLLGLKDKLEKRYFGRTFNDNLHIQIIYNILDIEKILAEYATIIVAALDHMIDEELDTEKEDFIGYMGTQNTYEVFMDPSKSSRPLKENAVVSINSSREKFEKLIASGRLGYLGFEYDPKGKDRKKNEEIRKRLYHLTAFAGQLRQWCFHGDEGFKRIWLYQFENKLDREYLETLDYFFDKRFDEINGHFVEQNAVNLCILHELFPHEDFKAVADLYYDFIVIKSQKNMGFSVKTLREKMLESEDAAPIKAQDMDSVRSKLYKLIDFCIFKYYHETPELSQKNVDILRSAVTDEQKESFYTDEAARLWSIFGVQFLGFCKKINTWVTGERTKEVMKYIDGDAYRRDSRVSYFSKLMYSMCLFLDGKEINDLLSTLINKFDNIGSFIRTAKDLSIDVAFTKDYSFFDRSADYVAEINIVKNISRMKKPSSQARKVMYADALRILGLPSDMDDDRFADDLEKILEKKKDPVTGKPVKGSNPFRNFIANNVIENRRFIYIIRFCNPENVRKLVNNTKVTEFVLRRMPETQINRYYSSCIDSELNPTVDKKIEALADMMKRMEFSMFRSVKQKTKSREEALEKERFKAEIGLYLTVVYLLVKNLVKVNSRYALAFHCLERDAALYDVALNKDYLLLVEKLLAEGDNSRSRYLARNKRLRECVAVDTKNARDLNITTWYRNKVAHLTAIRRCDDFIEKITKIDSYFALYHFLIQKQLEKGINEKRRHSGLTAKYFDDLDKWNTYVKDMVKALNAPFGYNIPRFKNLSIDALFDRNELKPLTDEDKCLAIDKKP